jgi:hypothetical protein
VPSYAQWRLSADKGSVSKVMWLCGDQRILVEEVIQVTKDILKVSEFDYFPLSAESNSETDIWDAAYQYSLDPDGNRLILVRQADHIKDWASLSKWILDAKNLPTTYIIFVSDLHDYPMTSDLKNPGVQPHISLIRKKGKAIKCSMPSQADIITWIKRNSTFSDYSANFLFDRCGSDLSAVANVCKKSLLFKSDPGHKVISDLAGEYASQSFVDCLIFQDKKAALLELPNVPESDYAKAVGMLYSRLDVLYALHKAGPNFNTTRELSEATDIKMFLVSKYLQISKVYDKTKVTNCRNILTVSDDALQRNITSGVLELLVSLW